MPHSPSRKGRIVVKAATIKALACATALFAFSPLLRAHAEPSAALCTQYANNYAQQNNNKGQLLGGAVGGSAVGAGIGLIFSAPGAGAAVGAGLGLIGGGAKKSESRKKIFEDAFIDCMAGRVQ
jgi:hypothetical protein